MAAAALRAAGRGGGAALRGARGAAGRAERGADAELGPGDADALRAAVAAGEGSAGGRVLEGAEAVDAGGYNEDWTGRWRGRSRLVVQPRDTAGVSRVLAHCHERGLAVVPQGGNTGLVGGSVPVHDEVVLNLGRMDRVLCFDARSGILSCQAGCVLERLQDFCEQRGHVVPLDLGSKGTCQIGGNVSTNAGGLRLIRYGSLHGSVLGLEAVLADGTVVDTMQGLRKDNTGYDLKQLFIGAEGTLGVVTAISLLCPPAPRSRHLAFLACESFARALDVFSRAKLELGETLSAFEFLDRQCLELALGQLEGVRDPLPGSQSPFYVLVETAGVDAESAALGRLEAFLEACAGAGELSDGAVAQDGAQAKGFWRLREGVNESLARSGYVYKYDLSVPVDAMYGLVEATRARVGGAAAVFGYGHVGDGNLHLNVTTPEFCERTAALLEPFVYEWTAEHNGSVSAEHGVGLMKVGALRYTKSEAAVSAMRAIKQTLDPRGILNPYKVLPPPPGAA